MHLWYDREAPEGDGLRGGHVRLSAAHLQLTVKHLTITNESKVIYAVLLLEYLCDMITLKAIHLSCMQSRHEVELKVPQGSIDLKWDCNSMSDETST